MKSRRLHRVSLLISLVGLSLTACLPGAGGGGTGGGGSVSFLGQWGGSEQQSFLALVKPFEDQTGIKVNYTGSRDESAILTTRLKAGNPPDVAGVPGPGQMIDWAKKGQLKSLDGVLDMNQMNSQYSADWVKLGAVNGKHYGVFMKVALKGLIWYDPKVFAAKGYSVPKTWDELTALAARMKASGTAPWCVALNSGATTGWPGTDWVEDIFLRQAGPDKYDQWTSGKLPFTSPEVKQAFQTFGSIVNTGMVYGGKQTTLSTTFQTGADPVYSNPPKCYMHHQASFMSDFIKTDNPALKAKTDYDYFPFPDINPAYSGAKEVAGDLVGMFKDTSQARQLVKYLTTAQAQSVWVKRGGALSANKEVSSSDYPDELSKGIAQELVAAKIARFDASDLDPGALADAYNKAMVDYVNNPSSLDSILAHLDAVAKSSFTT